MATENITPIRPDVEVRLPLSFPETVHATLMDQLSKMGEAMATVRLSAAAIRTVYACDSIGSLPIDSSLRGAARMLDEVYGELMDLESSAEAMLEAVQQ